jgi:hypothetical protein
MGYNDDGSFTYNDDFPHPAVANPHNDCVSVNAYKQLNNELEQAKEKIKSLQAKLAENGAALNGVALRDWLSSVAAPKIEKALNEYRLQQTVLEDGGGLPLVDALSPPGDDDIRRGKEEIELLTDSIIGELLDNAAVDAAMKETQCQPSA